MHTNFCYFRLELSPTASHFHVGGAVFFACSSEWFVRFLKSDFYGTLKPADFLSTRFYIELLVSACSPIFC